MGSEEYDPPSDARIDFDLDGEAARESCMRLPRALLGAPSTCYSPAEAGPFLTSSSGAFSLHQQPNKLLSRRTTARRERAALETSSATPPTPSAPSVTGPWVGHLSRCRLSSVLAPVATVRHYPWQPWARKARARAEPFRRSSSSLSTQPLSHHHIAHYLVYR